MSIYDQLKDYCDCVDAFTEDDVNELVDVISMATCWMTKPCDTFLLSERREVVDLPDCLDCAFVFEPFYKPFDPESFSFKVVTQHGLEDLVEEVSDFMYSEVDENFRLDLPIPKCKCKCKCGCGCDPKYKLVVTYNAGYDGIPDCLLPVFCDLIQIVHAKNTCDCDDCQTCTIEYDANDPTKHIKYYKGDLITVNLETDLARLLVDQYKRQLAMMSLCVKQNELWGFVV